MGSRVLLVGLDSADADLVQRWADSGALPTLQRLRGAGLWGELVSPPGLGDDAAWGAFSTGVGPGRNGRFYHEQWLRGTDDPVRCRRDEMSGTPFWTVLGDAGRRVAVIDVPKSPIGDGEQLVVADWMCHGPDGPDVVCRPPQFKAELDRRFMPRPGFVCDQPPGGPIETAEFVDALRERSALRADLVTCLLRRDSWDLLSAVFAETHCIGHQHWHDHDPDHPDHDARVAAQTGDPIEQVYRGVDARLAEIVDAAGPETTVVVFSLLGMTANYSGEHLSTKCSGASSADRRGGRSGHKPSRGSERRFPSGFEELRPRPLRRVAQKLRALRVASPTVPRATCRSGVECDRVNVVGRDPHGVVSPGRDYDETCRELRRELLALTDPRTGVPLVRDVVSLTTSIRATEQENFADVLVVWSQDQPVRAAASSLIGEVRGRAPRTGPATTGRMAGSSRPGRESLRRCSNSRFRSSIWHQPSPRCSACRSPGPRDPVSTRSCPMRRERVASSMTTTRLRRVPPRRGAGAVRQARRSRGRPRS